MSNNSKPLILATTDFTEISQYAIDNAATFAKHGHGRLLILHVMDKYTCRTLNIKEESQALVEEKLNTIAREVRNKFGIEVEIKSLCINGNLYKTIGQVAKEENALIHFMGTHGKKGIQWLTGSFALKVVKKSPIPVFVIQEPAGNRSFKHMVYPLDLQVGSKQKVKWAVTLNRLLGTRFSVFVDSYHDQKTNNKLKADMRQLNQIMTQNGVPHEEVFAASPRYFAHQLMAHTREIKADAIIMSSDPDKLTWNPFNKAEERILYNKENVPVLFINSKNLNIVIGGA